MQVNEEYMKTLEVLSKKLKFLEADALIKVSKALKDIQPELERLRQKAVSKVRMVLNHLGYVVLTLEIKAKVFTGSKTIRRSG